VRRRVPYSEWTQEEKDARNARRREARAWQNGTPNREPVLLDRAITDHALCAEEGLDPEIFWHPKDRLVANPTIAPVDLLADAQLVAHICHACPVRQLCLDDARRTRSSGVWGGVLINDEGKEHDLIRLHVNENRSAA
jgi:hypothetical protein